jgi:hypothetical protein
MRHSRLTDSRTVECKIRNDAWENVFVLEDLLSETAKRNEVKGPRRRLGSERILDWGLTGILIDKGDPFELLHEVTGLERELQHANGERKSITALLLPWVNAGVRVLDIEYKGFAV